MFTYFFEHARYLNVAGIGLLLGISYLFSRDRAHINWRLVGNALLLQMAIGYLVLKTTIGQTVVGGLSAGIGRLYSFADTGVSFVFGNLANPAGPWGFIFGIKVLPIIIFFGALTSLFFYFGIIQRIVAGINWLIRPLLGTSGAETLCAVANSFLGQTEAPLLVRNYLKDMTKSELFVVMVSGMATISGSILAVFAAMGVPAQHMLAASVMAIPASIMIAKILYPETARSTTAAGGSVAMPSGAKNIFDALATGTSDGLSLAVNVAAMLIAFISLIALVNAVLGFGSTHINCLLTYVGVTWQMPALSLGWFFGIVFSPITYFMGLSGEEAVKAAQLLGTKVTVNELVAYGQMLGMGLSERTVALMTYALCGFSNFSCIGIQIGGIGALAPEKRQWLTELGLFTVLGSSLANLMSAFVAGILL